MNATRPALAAALSLTFATQGRTQPAPVQDADRAGIARVLQTSAADWSQGDLSAFMQSYEDATGTAFVTPDGLIKGYGALKAHYAAKYASGTHRMGRLALVLSDDRPLSPDYALVTGRFTLTRPAADGGNATGIFTLLMHRTAQGWRIAYDHTS